MFLNLPCKLIVTSIKQEEGPELQTATVPDRIKSKPRQVASPFMDRKTKKQESDNSEVKLIDSTCYCVLPFVIFLLLSLI